MASVETIYLNPAFDASNFKTEFHIPRDKVYSPSIRLCGVGLVSSATNAQYNRLVGSQGVIRNIILTDKGTEIDSCKRCNVLEGFKSLNFGGPRDQSFEAQKTRNTLLGFDHTITRAADGSGETSQMRDSIGANGNRKETTKERRNEIAAQSSTNVRTGDSYILLHDYLPVLAQMAALPTNVFDDLKLTIEYETTLSKCLATSVNVPHTTLAPVLVMDQINDVDMAQNALKQLRSFMWNTYEHDMFVVQAADGTQADTGTRQLTSARLNGFKNKTIGKMLLVKQLQNQSDGDVVDGTNALGYGNMGSVACFDEQLQVRVNGANAMPGQGITKPNEALALMADTFGQITMSPFGHAYNGSNYNTTLADMQTEKVMENGSQKTGRLSYFGLPIHEKVTDMQIIYSRVQLLNEDPGTNHGGIPPGSGWSSTKPLNVHCFCEVAKSITFQAGGQYVIAYV